MASNPQPLDGIADQEDIRLTVTMTAVGSIATDTFTAVLKNAVGTVVATKTVGAGITVSNPGGTGTYGVIVVVFAAADIHTAGVGDASYEVWRSTAGRHARLAYGACPIAAESAL